MTTLNYSKKLRIIQLNIYPILNFVLDIYLILSKCSFLKKFSWDETASYTGTTHSPNPG